VRLTVLGCAGSLPGPAGPCSSYLVEHDGFRLVLDLGSGALSPLQRAIGLYDVDAIAISHLHGDHCLDLCGYDVARRHRPEGPLPPVPLLGPAGTAERIASAALLAGPAALASTYTVQELSEGRREVGPFTLTTARMVHPIETYAMRVEAGGRSLTYSADTAPTRALVDLAADTDLLLCEASWLDGEDNPPGLHLTGAEAGEHAQRAGARLLVLTHLTVWGDAERSLAAAAGRYDGQIRLAASGATHEV